MSDGGWPAAATGASLVVSGVGAFVAAATVGEWAYLLATGGAFAPGRAAVGALLNLVPALALAYGGVWLHRGDVTSDRHGRVAAWCLAGLAISLVFNGVIMLAFPPDPLVFAIGWGRTAVIVGAIVGFVVGVVEARAIDRSLVAERARVRAEEAERQREQLDYLNSLLRHEVLNAVNVIDGQSTYIVDRNDVDDDTRERLEAVRRQSHRMSDVITDVRLLIEATRDTPSVEPLDVADVVEAEVTAVRDRHESVEVTTDLPADAAVEADELLARIFGNLLDNAVEHNDSDTPRIEVRGECDDETVTITVADNGPGVPQRERDVMFERGAGSNHGLGLYLVRTLAERYDGTVALTETGSDGSVFTVELPLESADVDGTATPSASSSSADSPATDSPSPESSTAPSSSNVPSSEHSSEDGASSDDSSSASTSSPPSADEAGSSPS